MDEIIKTCLVGKGVVARLLQSEPGSDQTCTGTGDLSFYTRQHRRVLADCGLIDPENLDEYLHHGGYEAARKACVQMSPEEICEEIVESGLRGRGGGGCVRAGVAAGARVIRRVSPHPPFGLSLPAHCAALRTAQRERLKVEGSP